MKLFNKSKLFLIFFFLCNLASAKEIEGCSPNNAYVVFEEKNLNILLEKNANDIIYPASLVKLMTLYLTFESLEKKIISLNTEIKISARGEEISKVNKVNTLNLRQGYTITVREAIYSVIVRSFNEAAVALAEIVGKDEWQFVNMMNRKAQELGMYRTSFRNSSGLHEISQYTTALDLARLAIAIKKNFPDYYHLFSLKFYKFNHKKYETHNHILEEYQGSEGLKTGFTFVSGFNLIAAAKKSNVRVISVLIGCSSASKREQFTKILLNKAFKKIPHEIYPEISGKIRKTFSYSDNNIYTPY